MNDSSLSKVTETGKAIIFNIIGNSYDIKNVLRTFCFKKRLKVSFLWFAYGGNKNGNAI